MRGKERNDQSATQQTSHVLVLVNGECGGVRACSGYTTQVPPTPMGRTDQRGHHTSMMHTLAQGPTHPYPLEDLVLAPSAASCLTASSVTQSRMFSGLMSVWMMPH